MQAQTNERLKALVAQVNQILAEEVRLSDPVVDPLTNQSRPHLWPAASVYPAARTDRPCIETPWGYFLPIARHKIGPQGKLVASEKIESTAPTLARRLGVPVAFESAPTPGGGPLLLWVPKSDPDPAYYINAVNRTQLGPASGIVGVDRWNRAVTVDLLNGLDHHVVILGTTTAGKSIIAEMMLLSMCLRTGPDLMRLVIFDCKGRNLQSLAHLPHTALYAGGGMSNKDEILAGVAALERLMDARLAQGVSEPLLVALFDDGREPEDWSDAYPNSLGRLLRLGAAAGVRVVITAQQLATKWAGDASRENLATRIISGTDVTTAASQAGRGGTSSHLVDRKMREWVVVRNGRSQTIYAPHVCQKGRFLDLNRNDIDDVDEFVSTCQARYEARPLSDLDRMLLDRQPGAAKAAFTVMTKAPRAVGGVTFDEAVVDIADLLEEKPDARLADIAEKLWGERVWTGNAKKQFMSDALAEARKEGP